MTVLPQSEEGKDAILLCVDRLSEMGHFIATETNVIGAGVDRLFFENVWKLHGMPQELISYRDVRFTSELWRNLMSLAGTQLKMSSVRHPESDGQTERINRVLEESLRCYVDARQKDWRDKLAVAEFAYNQGKQKSTGFNAFYLNTGEQPIVPLSFVGRRRVESSIRGVQEIFGVSRMMWKKPRPGLPGLRNAKRKRQMPKRRKEDFELGQ